MATTTNPLTIWLERSAVRKIDLAQVLRLEPSEITRYCSEGYWPKQRAAERIFNATGGDVTPNDFLAADVERSRALRSREHREITQIAARRRAEREAASGEGTKESRRGNARVEENESGDGAAR
jgi:hypothetical protein